MAKTKPTPVKMSADERRWQVEDALRTLQRAEQIKRDGGLMKDVKKAAMDLNKMVFGGEPKSSSKLMSKPTPKKK